jgi:hypothetical protein
MDKDTNKIKETSGTKPDVMRPLPYQYEGNWTEDFTHENGNYMNTCIRCKNDFMGHKRRVVCKKCWGNGA